jgi:hypothetical protein
MAIQHARQAVTTRVGHSHPGPGRPWHNLALVPVGHDFGIEIDGFGVPGI